MRNNKRKGNVLVILAVIVLLCAGCAKQPSSFEPTAGFSYDDSQDINRAANSDGKQDRKPGNPDAVAKVLENVAAQKITMTEKKADVQTESLKEHSEHEVSLEEYPEENTINEEDAKREQLSENAAERKQNNNSTMKDPYSGLSNQRGQLVGEQRAVSTEERSDLGEKTAQKPDTEGKKSGKSSGSKEAKDGNQSESKEKDKEEKGKDESEEPESAAAEEPSVPNEENGPDLDPGKLVSLSCEGELGTYIWGEAANLSDLTVKAVFEDGHEEAITDYEIDMNYPELFDPGVYTYECHSNPQPFDCYTPGIYNATIAYKEETIEVPYTLIIMYVLISVEHKEQEEKTPVRIEIKKNTLKVTVSKKTFKRSKLKKAKKFSIGAKRAKGKVTYTLNKKAKKAGITVSKKGRVTIPKKCRKGTYKITVKAAGKGTFKAGKKTVTIRII